MRQFLFIILPLLVGCTHRSDTYVTRAELRDLLAAPGVDQDLALATNRQGDAARLAAATFVAPTAVAAKSAPDALVTADRYTSRLADAVRAAEQGLDVCAHNISNAQTTAFKAMTAVRRADGSADLRMDLAQGSLEATNRPLDVAISGNGFFKVKILDSTGDGFGYTRSGNFFVNNEGQVVLGMGDSYKLDPPIRVPPGVSEISISEAGVVNVLIPGQEATQNVGQLELVQFINPQGLNVLGGCLYASTTASGEALKTKPGENGAGVTLQGFLEASNVDLAREYIRVRFLTNWRNVILRAIDAGR
jgi:flagellar basal body rod protein FlgG